MRPIPLTSAYPLNTIKKIAFRKFADYILNFTSAVQVKIST
jgi:hypothetical protein